MAIITSVSQWYNLIISVLTFAILIALWIKRPAYRYLYAAPIVASVIGVAFYVAIVLLGYALGFAMQMWGAVHRSLLLTLILGGCVGLYIILDDKRYHR